MTDKQHAFGLTDHEFDELLNKMDDDSNDAIHGELKLQLPHFNKFDKNADRMIDLMEFEEELNLV